MKFNDSGFFNVPPIGMASDSVLISKLFIMKKYEMLLLSQMQENKNSIKKNSDIHQSGFCFVLLLL